MIRSWFTNTIVLMAFIAFIAGCAGKNLDQNQKARPDPELARLVDFENDLTGFTKTYGPNFYAGEKLYDYINGGADKYISLGFKEIMSFELQRGDVKEEKVIVDIYDMANQKNSSLIFDQERTGKNVMLPGNLAASLSENLIQFSKSKYYVKVTSFAELKPEILVNIASLIALKINK